MKSLFSLLTIALALHFTSQNLQAQTSAPQKERIRIKSSEITNDGAYCWFADPRALHFVSKDKSIDRTFLGWINRSGNVVVCQYDHKTGIRNDIVVRKVFELDDHDNPTFLVLPDERIMIFYMKHTSERKIWYRISKNKGDILSLMEEQSLDTDHNTTYPSPFILSDDPDHIYLTWRGIKWHPTIAKLQMPTEKNDYTTKFVSGPWQIVHSNAQNTGTQGASCRPYAKYISDGKNRIYLAFTATHPDNINPTLLYAGFVDIRDMTFRDLNAKILDQDITKDPIFTVTNHETITSKPGYTVADDRNIRHWIWDSALGEDGSYYIAFTKISPDKTKHSYYYGKWSNGKWNILKLADAGRWFHQSPNTEKCYSAGLCIDHNNPQYVYASVPINNVYEIVRYEISKDATSISSQIPITTGSGKNNVRPYVISGPTTENNLIWMYGDYYYWIIRDPNKEKDGFYTSIRTNFNFPAKKNLQKNQ